ncbi:hypothetical protein BU14_0074s0028 [Porphyra umbilicalis]|uniref:Uncharacterized protein n=1 Tax=Porphyra umbilicalis TaxID=2786 RepID=A0A1X6PFS5_PORUM|nr:hypothetical protein BU14_0074s0028 [Porphyra umbilicalis]|eukprot:OSX79596.1 hypothetical protein BU14_0074s0028 [Porphyra umbilicalis]
MAVRPGLGVCPPRRHRRPPAGGGEWGPRLARAPGPSGPRAPPPPPPPPAAPPVASKRRRPRACDHVPPPPHMPQQRKPKNPARLRQPRRSLLPRHRGAQRQQALRT